MQTNLFAPVDLYQMLLDNTTLVLVWKNDKNRIFPGENNRNLQRDKRKVIFERDKHE